MYYSIRGKVIKKDPGLIVLESAGVGYELLVSVTSYEATPALGENFRLYTYLQVREDILQLYGFAILEEKDLFLKLISMSGIGPKNALNILSSVSVAEFKRIIIAGDISRLKSIPGIGPKTAKRLIIELKEKMSDEEIAKVLGGGQKIVLSSTGNDALAALETLGFRKADVMKSVEQILADKPDTQTEEIIRLILRNQNK